MILPTDFALSKSADFALSQSILIMQNLPDFDHAKSAEADNAKSADFLTFVK